MTNQWSNKQKRAYHRVKSGVRLSNLLGIPIQHIVLTTSPEGKSRNLSNDFQALRKRIRRKFGIEMPYFCVRTNEGNGVLHLIVRNNGYIPQRWLSAQWSEIHQSPYVYIKRPPKHIANYVISQYVSAQGSSYQRCSWSQSWVCKGFCNIWHSVKESSRDWENEQYTQYNELYYPINYKEAIDKWDLFLVKLSKNSDFYKTYNPEHHYDLDFRYTIIDEFGNNTFVYPP